LLLDDLQCTAIQAGESALNNRTVKQYSADKQARRGVTCGAILRQNMKRKNNDLDRWRSSVRAPFEGVF
jgi:hypothetical protein